MDEFEFDTSSQARSLPSRVASMGSANSSSRDSFVPLRHGGGKTKAARLKLHTELLQQAIDKSVRFSIEDSERESIDSALQPHRSQSVGSRKRKSRRQLHVSDASSTRSHCTSICSSLNDHKENRSSISSSSLRSSLSSRDHKRERSDREGKDDRIQVQGAGLNVMAVQDAGSYRMLLDECLYLTSTISASKNAQKTHNSNGSADGALWDLASILSNRQNRKILWSSSEASLDSILLIFASIPSSCQYQMQQHHTCTEHGSWRAELEITHETRIRQVPKTAHSSSSLDEQRLGMSEYESLSSIMYFLSQDCTTSASSSSANAAAARNVRRKLLRNTQAFQGMSQLMLLTTTISSPATDGKSFVAQEPEVESVSHELSTCHDDDDDTRLSVASYTSSSGTLSTLRDSIADEKTAAAADQSHRLLSTKRKSEDPTSVGRRNRQRLRQTRRCTTQTNANSLSPVEEHGPCAYDIVRSNHNRGRKDLWSFSDTDEHSNRPQKCVTLDVGQKSDRWVVDIVKSKIAWNKRGLCLENDNEMSRAFIQTVAIESMCRILHGKEEGEETSCLDLEDAELEDEDDDENKADSKESEREIETSNPVLVTNKLLLESGVLTIFAATMADALNELCQSGTKSGSRSHLQSAYNLPVLATLIDSSCLLSDDNRNELCRSGSLTSSLFKFLRRALAQNHDVFLEYILIAMRTLTSLTHENPLAGRQCGQHFADVNDKSQMQLPCEESITGVEVLLQLLYQTVMSKNGKDSSNDDRSRQEFDVIIFCLNTITNVIEACHIQSSLSSIFVTSSSCESNKENVSFLPWLAQWIVEETSTFRESVLHGSFGTTTRSFGQSEVKDLDNDAEEHLVTAGNGLILLSCIIIQGEKSIRESILCQVKSAGGYKLIINTLKAFCNFYYYSVGDLSVAVVAPVKKLITELERLRVSEMCDQPVSEPSSYS